MSDVALTTSLRRRPSGVLVLTELAHALAFLPLLLLGFILLPVFPVTLTLAAEAERACARLVGAQASSSRRSGEQPGLWLVTRAKTTGFWTRDLPLALVKLLLCALSLLGAVARTALGAILCAVPSRISAQAPLDVDLLVWSTQLTSPGQA